MYAPGTLRAPCNPPYSHHGIKYGRLVITATFFGHPAKRPYIFLWKTLVNAITREYGQIFLSHWWLY